MALSWMRRLLACDAAIQAPRSPGSVQGWSRQKCQILAQRGDERVARGWGQPIEEVTHSFAATGVATMLPSAVHFGAADRPLATPQPRSGIALISVYIAVEFDAMDFCVPSLSWPCGIAARSHSGKQQQRRTEGTGGRAGDLPRLL